jgi:hypothetical protein
MKRGWHGVKQRLPVVRSIVTRRGLGMRLRSLLRFFSG